MDTPRNLSGNLDVETRGPDALEYEESEDSEDDALPYDESDEMSLVALSWVLAIHLFAVAVTVPVLPSLLLDIMQDDHAAAARLTGWLHGGRALIQFFTMPFLGAISDVRGRKPVIGIGLLGSAFSWAMIAANPCVGTIVVGTIVLGTTVSVVTTSFAAITDVTARILRQRRAARKSLERYLRRSSGQQGGGSGGCGRQLFTNPENLAINLPRVPRPTKVVSPLHPKATRDNARDAANDKKASRSTAKPPDAPPVSVLDDFGTVGYSRPETPKIGTTGASARKVPASSSQLAPPLSTFRTSPTSSAAVAGGAGAAEGGLDAEKESPVAPLSSSLKKETAPSRDVGSSSSAQDEVAAVSAPDFRSMTSPVMAPVQTHASAADERKQPTSHTKPKDKSSKEKKDKKSRRDKREKLQSTSFDPSVESLPPPPAEAEEAATAGSGGGPSSSSAAQVGDRVLVRDLPSEAWAPGTVMALTAVTGGEFPIGHPIVRRDGWDLPFAFQDWEFLDPNAVARSNRRSAQVEKEVPPPPSQSTTPKVPPPSISPAAKAAPVPTAPAARTVPKAVATASPAPAPAVQEEVQEEDGPDWLSKCVVGDRLEVQDDGGDEGVWFAGVVTEAATSSGGLPCVMRDGWDEAFEWDHYRRPTPLDAKKSATAGPTTTTTLTAGPVPPRYSPHNLVKAPRKEVPSPVPAETDAPIPTAAAAASSPVRLPVSPPRAATSPSTAVPSAASSAMFSVGDEVEVRDEGESEWGRGTVTEVTVGVGDSNEDTEASSSLIEYRVRKVGFDAAYVWDEIRAASGAPPKLPAVLGASAYAAAHHQSTTSSTSSSSSSSTSTSSSSSSTSSQSAGTVDEPPAVAVNDEASDATESDAADQSAASDASKSEASDQSDATESDSDDDAPPPPPPLPTSGGAPAATIDDAEGGPADGDLIDEAVYGAKPETWDRFGTVGFRNLEPPPLSATAAAQLAAEERARDLKLDIVAAPEPWTRTIWGCLAASLTLGAAAFLTALGLQVPTVSAVFSFSAGVALVGALLVKCAMPPAEPPQRVQRRKLHLSGSHAAKTSEMNSRSSSANKSSAQARAAARRARRRQRALPQPTEEAATWGEDDDYEKGGGKMVGFGGTTCFARLSDDSLSDDDALNGQGPGMTCGNKGIAGRDVTPPENPSILGFGAVGSFLALGCGFLLIAACLHTSSSSASSSNESVSASTVPAMGFALGALFFGLACGYVIIHLDTLSPPPPEAAKQMRQTKLRQARQAAILAAQVGGPDSNPFAGLVNPLTPTNKAWLARSFAEHPELLAKGGIAPASGLLLAASAEKRMLRSAAENDASDDAEESSLLTQNFGIVGALWGVSFVFGPISGGLLIGQFGSARAACGVVAFVELLAYFVHGFTMQETVQRKAPQFHLSMANPIPPLMLFCSSSELGFLVVPLAFAVAASGVHAIMYLYFVVRFQWSAVHIGLFLSFVGMVTALTQGVLLPFLVPDFVSVRRAIPWGLAIHAVEYVLFAYCSQGWMLVVVLVVCCCDGLEPPALHALMSAEVPPHHQGALHGALASVQTLVSVVSVPLFAQLFAWAVGVKEEEEDGSFSDASILVKTGPELDLASSLKDTSGRDFLCAISEAAGSAMHNCTTPTDPTSMANDESSWIPSKVQGSENVNGGGDMMVGDFEEQISYENSHMELPFLVAASLFACAGLAAAAVLAIFPKLGRAALKTSEPGL